MNYLVRNRLFVIIVLFAILQQAAVGGSTLAIGAAARHLNHAGSVLSYLYLFFAWIIAAYLLGIATQWAATELANRSWAEFVKVTLHKVTSDFALATSANKKTVTVWMTAEAQSNFDRATDFTVDTVSAVFNVIFTVLAFYQVLGLRIGTAVLAGLFVTAVTLVLAKRNIARIADSVQRQRIGAFLELQGLWDKVFFGSRSMRKAATSRALGQMDQYRRTQVSEVLLAQSVATFPVFVAIVFIIIAVHSETNRNPAVLASVVALLPRSLQLLQSVHLVGSLGSQATALITKLRQLTEVVDQLPRRLLGDCIAKHRLQVRHVDSGAIIEADDVSNLTQSSTGRFCITGSNGAGKSTLLKILKEKTPEGILVGAASELLPHLTSSQSGSTGELQARTIRYAMSEKTPVLFLDEWDANLDHDVTKVLDRDISVYAKDHVVVEVRHKIP